MKDIGKKLMDIARWYSMPADHFNTIKEAVELLEQKPSYNSIKTELNELDCISRQSVLEKAYKIAGYDRNSYVVDVADIEALPSVSCSENTNRCEDAISRQALKDLGAECIAKRDENGNLIPLGSIDSLPSVSTEKTGWWIPVERELPELNKPLLVTAYHRVCYAHMISKNGNYGYPVFRLHELKDSDRGWIQETISHEPYGKGRIDAWMYIDIPQPYNGESEELDADSD